MARGRRNAPGGSHRDRRNDPSSADDLSELLLRDDREVLIRLVEETAALRARVGDDAALATSVRRVIVDVLREAGVQDHDRVADALAPLVVNTVAREIPRQPARIAQALRPYARRLVGVGLQGSVNGLAHTVESVVSPLVWYRRARAAMTGESVAMARLGPRIWGEGVAVLDRKTGDVVATSLPAERIAPLAQPALNVAASGNLPHYTRLMGERCWVAGDEAYLLIGLLHGPRAGQADKGMQRLASEIAKRWDETLAAAPRPVGPHVGESIVRDLSERFAAIFNSPLGERRPWPKPWFGYSVLVAATVAACVYGGMQVRQQLQERAVLETAAAALAGDPLLADLPLDLIYDPDRDRLAVRGVVAERGLEATLEERLAAVLPDLALDVLLIAPPPAPPAPLVPAPDAAMEDQVAALFARVNALQNQVAETAVQSWFERQTIQFSRGTEFADPALADQRVKSMARVFADWPDIFNLRVVGYSDATGSARGQDQAAFGRALRVVQALVAAGVPQERLMAVGRGASKPVSIIHGDDSLNRRVEFEVYTPPR